MEKRERKDLAARRQSPGLDAILLFDGNERSRGFSGSEGRGECGTGATEQMAIEIHFNKSGPGTTGALGGEERRRSL